MPTCPGVSGYWASQLNKIAIKVTEDRTLYLLPAMRLSTWLTASYCPNRRRIVRKVGSVGPCWDIYWAVMVTGLKLSRELQLVPLVPLSSKLNPPTGNASCPREVPVHAVFFNGIVALFCYYFHNGHSLIAHMYTHMHTHTTHTHTHTQPHMHTNKHTLQINAACQKQGDRPCATCV